MLGSGSSSSSREAPTKQGGCSNGILPNSVLPPLKQTDALWELFLPKISKFFKPPSGKSPVQNPLCFVGASLTVVTPVTSRAPCDGKQTNRVTLEKRMNLGKQVEILSPHFPDKLFCICSANFALRVEIEMFALFL